RSLHNRNHVLLERGVMVAILVLEDVERLSFVREGPCHDLEGGPLGAVRERHLLAHLEPRGRLAPHTGHRVVKALRGFEEVAAPFEWAIDDLALTEDFIDDLVSSLELHCSS